MKRKELKLYTSSEIEDIDYNLLVASEDGTIKMTRVYIAAEADKVMDEMEARIKELEAENARLKKQVPVWHDLTKPLYTEDGVNYYDLPAEHGEYIVDCGGQVCTHSEYDPDDNDFCNVICTAKVLRWCEFPPTEESSATEKENR